MLLSDWAAELYKWYEDDPEYIAAGLMIDITDQFNARMQELGLSQRDLAKRIGCSQPYINKLLNHGTNMTLKTLVMMAQALDLVVESPRIFHKAVNQTSESVLARDSDLSSERTKLSASRLPAVRVASEVA